MSSTLRLVILSFALLAFLQSPVTAALFSEDFNDGQAATRWSVASQQEVRNPPPPYPPDGAVDFAFDYSSLGLTNPQGGADTTGAYIRVNLTDQSGNEGESYSIYPTGKSFSGDFFLECDMFVYNPQTTAGATEYGMAGVFLDNADPVSPYQLGSKGGPLAWKYSGDGRTGTDLAVLKEGSATSTGYMSLGAYDAMPPGAIPGFETGSMLARGPAPAGPNEKGSWVNVRIESAGSIVTWLLNGAVVNSYDNSGGHYTAGNILIGAADPFNSVGPQAGGVIVDNVVVGVPEPASGLLAALSELAVIALVRRRRRLAN